MGSRRALCVEKLTFDKEGLIQPVWPTSSGISGGFATNGKPIYFNTSVIKKNSQFVRNKGDTGFGSAVVRGKVELGFRYVIFTGNEKKILFHGEDVENIDSVGVFANGKLISSKFEDGTIRLVGVEAGRKELRFIITAKSGKTAKLDTFSFAS
jgi:hypothetical protein